MVDNWERVERGWWGGVVEEEGGGPSEDGESRQLGNVNKCIQCKSYGKMLLLQMRQW